MLNKSKPYEQVFGKPGVSFTQDGKLYNGMGIKVDWDGNPLEKQTMLAEKDLPPEPKPKEAEPLTWDGSPDSAISKNESTDDEPDEDPEGFDLIDRIKVAAKNNPLYLKSGEIKDELKKRGIKYRTRDTRDDLLALLKDHLGV